MPKKIIILVTVLVGAFIASCGLTLLLGGPEQEPASQPAASQTDEDGAPGRSGFPLPAVGAAEQRQLQDLVNELRSKMAEYERREKDIERRERQLELAQEILRKEAQRLEDLRVRLVGPLNELKEARAALDQSRVVIAREEEENLKRTATIYEKMDSRSGSRILVAMCADGRQDDAAKLLYYMSDRSAGKMLADMTDAKLAASLSERLKKIRQGS